MREPAELLRPTVRPIGWQLYTHAELVPRIVSTGSETNFFAPAGERFDFDFDFDFDSIFRADPRNRMAWTAVGARCV
jgi:hypothetical protein